MNRLVWLSWQDMRPMAAVLAEAEPAQRISAVQAIALATQPAPAARRGPPGLRVHAGADDIMGTG